MLRSKSQLIAHAVEDVKQGEYATHIATLGNQYGDLSEKLELNLLQDPVISLLHIYPKDDQSYHKDKCSTMFIAALFLIVKTWKQPSCPSTEEWMKKMWYVRTMEYYSAVKNNDIMKFIGKWKKLEKKSS